MALAARVPRQINGTRGGHQEYVLTYINLAYTPLAIYTFSLGMASMKQVCAATKPPYKSLFLRPSPCSIPNETSKP